VEERRKREREDWLGQSDDGGKEKKKGTVDRKLSSTRRDYIRRRGRNLEGPEGRRGTSLGKKAVPASEKGEHHVNRKKRRDPPDNCGGKASLVQKGRFNSREGLVEGKREINVHFYTDGGRINL